MIQVHIHTLIVSAPHAPSIIVLRPEGEEPTKGISRIVPIWVGINEATQLGAALEHARFSRPLTHDLFLDALTNLDARVDHVLINDVRKSTFYSRLYLRQHGRLIDLDARPSDSIALAVRQHAPIYIADSVLERASFPYVVRKRLSPQEEMDEFRTFLENVAPDDFEQFEESIMHPEIALGSTPEELEQALADGAANQVPDAADDPSADAIAAVQDGGQVEASADGADGAVSRNKEGSSENPEDPSGTAKH